MLHGEIFYVEFSCNGVQNHILCTLIYIAKRRKNLPLKICKYKVVKHIEVKLRHSSKVKRITGYDDASSKQDKFS